MQKLPTAVSDLLSFAENIANSLELHGPRLGMAEMPPTEFRRVLSEAGRAEAAWSTAENSRLYSQGRMAMADKEITAWLAKARLVIKLARGEKWSERWVETGFEHRVAKIPKRIDSRIGLARRLVNFLSLHPEYGVQFAGVTAARGRMVCERTVQTRAALELARSDCAAKKRVRNTAKRILQRAIQGIIRALDSIITPNDPRWLELGLNQSTTTSTRRIRHEDFLQVHADPASVRVLAAPRPDVARTVAA
jgi:hypothetical protein